MCNSNSSAYSDRCNGMLCVQNKDCASNYCHENECKEEMSGSEALISILITVAVCAVVVGIVFFVIRRNRRRKRMRQQGEDSSSSHGDEEKRRRKAEKKAMKRAMQEQNQVQMVNH